MKKRILWALGALLLIAVMPGKAFAYGNDYLEKEYNYRVYSSGVDKIHFTIPIFSESSFIDYIAQPTSRVAYKLDSGGKEVLIANWCAEPYGDNENDENGTVNGCGTDEPVILRTSGSQTQNIELAPGWNWISSYLFLQPSNARISEVVTVTEPWSEGDIIKNPPMRHFVVWSDSLERFVGDFDYLRYIYTYMIYSQNGNTMHISGNALPADSMYVPVRGNGQWSAMPCLLNQVTPITEALADYYSDATPGDMLKSHDHFAYFSEDKKWEGDLTAMRPGEGYFFRRMAPDSVIIRFFNQESNSASAPTAKRSHSASGLTGEAGLFSNPNAATNMTMIAQLDNGQWTMDH